MKEQIKPEIRLAVFDETQYINEEIAEKTGKVFYMYLVDMSVNTHLCSLTPSIWLRCAGFFTEKEIDDDTHDSLQETIYESNNYYEIKSVGKSNSIDVTEHHIDDFPGYDDEDEYDAWFNDIVEYYQCNTMECELADLIGLKFI